MGDKLIMSQKERSRKSILDKVYTNHLSIAQAAKRLGVCKRTISRSLRRYMAEGDAGLIHKSRGKPSGRAKPKELKEQVLSLYVDKYEGFGPTFASEKLEEDDKISINKETLRLWLISAGLWSKRRKRKLHRSRRTRKARYGEMLQLDGSIHAWFDGVDEKQCLMNLVDDATGKTLALLDYGETTRGALCLLKWWILEAGIPKKIYVDLKSLYVSPKSLKQKLLDGEEQVDPGWLTHFSKACQKLGIEIIKAYSPQAKGRVERSHAVYQDRFVKELKLRGIKTIEGANELLANGFINKLNEKFAKEPADDVDGHVELLESDDLDQILCWEERRTLSNDCVVRYNNRYLQIKGKSRLIVYPRASISIRRHLDESISLWFKGKQLSFEELDTKPKQEQVTKKKYLLTSREGSRMGRRGKHKSPWSTYNPDWLKPRTKKGDTT